MSKYKKPKMLHITEEDLDFLIRIENKLGTAENWSDDVRKLWELNERLIKQRDNNHEQDAAT